MLDVNKVLEVRKGLTRCWSDVKSLFHNEDVVLSLMLERGYDSDYMFEGLLKKGVSHLESTFVLRNTFGYSDEELVNWGLMTYDGNFLLDDRYVLPIFDFSGTQVVSMVGWRKGASRKYITLDSYGFYKSNSFFGFEGVQDAIGSGGVIVVEGIYDTVSLQAQGLPALGVMGLDMSPMQSEILTRFGGVVAIPDFDKAGDRVSPVFNRVSGKGSSSIWGIDSALWVTYSEVGVKDMDDMSKRYDLSESFQDLLNMAVKEHSLAPFRYYRIKT